VKLARRLDCDLSGLIYVLDEPSAGLHPAEARKLAGILKALSRAGNAVLMVEHDPALIAEADWAIEIGPGAGRSGGRLLYAGAVAGLAKQDAPTGRVLRNGRTGGAPLRSPGGATRRGKVPSLDGQLPHPERSLNNLKNVSVDIPRAFLWGLRTGGLRKILSLILDEFAAPRPDAVVVGQTAIGRTPGAPRQATSGPST
jgi:excinuclease UvrABC ATPase subunit